MTLKQVTHTKEDWFKIYEYWFNADTLMLKHRDTYIAALLAEIDLLKSRIEIDQWERENPRENIFGEN